MPFCDNSHLKGTKDEDPEINYNVAWAKTGGGSGWVDDGRYAVVIEAAQCVKTKGEGVDTHNAKLTLRITAPDEQAGVQIVGDYKIEGTNFVDSIMRSVHSGMGNLEKAAEAGVRQMRVSKIVGRAAFVDTKTEIGTDDVKRSKVLGWVTKEDFEKRSGPFAPGRKAQEDDFGGASAKEDTKRNGAAAGTKSGGGKARDEFDLLSG